MNKTIIYNDELTEVQILLIVGEVYKNIFKASDSGKTFIIDINGLPVSEIPLEFDLIDDSNADFTYYGGTSHQKINRYSKISPFTKTTAIGTWGDKLIHTYT